MKYSKRFVLLLIVVFIFNYLNLVSLVENVAYGSIIYDCKKAVKYAEKYCDKACSDGLDFRDCGEGDCAHFVSCCIGSEKKEKGGGLDLGYRGKCCEKEKPYGYSGAAILLNDGAITRVKSDFLAWQLIPALLNRSLIEEVQSVDSLVEGDIIHYTISSGWCADNYIENYISSENSKKIGSIIKVKFPANIRKSYGINTTILRKKMPKDSTGIIIDGPKWKDQYKWWKVKFDTGVINHVVLHKGNRKIVDHALDLVKGVYTKRTYNDENYDVFLDEKVCGDFVYDIVHYYKVRVSSNSLPTVTTKSATDITSTSAKLNALVNPNGQETKVLFFYGTDQSNLINHTSFRPIGNGRTDVNVQSETINGLIPNTTYYFKAYAECPSGGVDGDIKSFKTLKVEKSEIEITSPKNGEIIKAEDQYTIKWNAKNLKNNIYIWYHTGDEKWINIAHNLPVDQTSYLWTVPNTPSEDCYLLVGSGKPTNNNTISLDVYDQVKFTIKSGKSEDDKLPDLQGVSYTVNSWSIKEGEMLQISVTVTNKGDGNANPSKLALYLSPHDDLDINDDYFVKKEYVGKLLPNDSQKVTFSFSIPDLGSGTYNMWLIFDVDCDKEVKESDERNTFKGNKPLEIKDSQAGGSQLSVPKTISPSCGSTITVPPTGVTFTWSSVSGATYYEFELYKGSERRAYEKYNTTSCSWDLGDKEDEYLCWRVRACNNSGCGQWSELCCFTKKVKSGGGNPPDNKPQPPKNLTATAGDGYVELSWSPSSSSNLQGYRIYRGTSSGGESFYDAVPQTRTTYKNTNVNNGTTYYYYVTALDKNGNESEPSNRVSATPNKSGGGSPPSDEKVKLTLYVHEGSSNGPTISGASVSGYDAKNNYFSKTTNNSGYVEIEGVPGNWSFKITKSGYKDNNWNQSITSTCTKHAYIEKDSNSGGGSEKPQPPKNLKAEVVFDSSTRKAGIRISWDAPSSSSVTKYRMYRKEEGGSYSSIGDRDSAYTTFRDWGITLGKKYYYKVSSINNSGESDFSNEANIIAGVLVTTNAKLNVRKGAGLSYDVIVTLPKGTYGLAIGGPSKADGYYWWYCFWNYNNNNYYGWSIEDGLDFYSGPLSIKEPIDVITCFIFSNFRCPILCQEYLSNDNKLLHYEIGY